jgi:hypothetical protein
VTKLNREEAGFFDASLWENTKRQGNDALKRLINSGLENTSVTCILIGAETYNRPWVRYEILKSYKRGNQILGVHINSIEGRNERTKPLGANPLQYVGVTFSNDGKETTLWELISGNWAKYEEIDGSASYQITGVAQEYCGKGYNLGNWYPVYDWVQNNGFENFSNWIG